MKNETKTSKGWGIASLVCGILSIVLFMAPYFGFPTAVMAFVFSLVHAQKNRWDGLAVGGMITSIIGAVLSLVTGLMLFIVLSV